jgi:hypothetical protein
MAIGLESLSAGSVKKTAQLSKAWEKKRKPLDKGEKLFHHVM